MRKFIDEMVDARFKASAEAEPMVVPTFSKQTVASAASTRQAINSSKVKTKNNSPIVMKSSSDTTVRFICTVCTHRI